MFFSGDLFIFGPSKRLKGLLDPFRIFLDYFFQASARQILELKMVNNYRCNEGPPSLDQA